MQQFLENWADAALTTAGFFWMALWAFCLGYLISSMIQVFVTRERMQRTMGDDGPRAVFLGTVFGFISSSCSFAAISTSRALYQKGAGLVPALAFLLASTNLVIELGIVIFVFLSWQFVVGEYVGGIILILVMWAVVRLTLPKGLAEAARQRAEQAREGRDHDHEHEDDEHNDGEGDHGQGGHAGGDAEEDELPDWRERITSVDGWAQVARQYRMEWQMVWKDVTFGFTVAGIIAAYVPDAFFQTLFVGTGAEGGAAWWQIVAHTLIGPIAAFFTFIGSMGNIPLAAVLFGSGVSFAGIMAFIFSDLVVFPMLRIMGNYFGWKMAAYILGVFLVCLVVASLSMHFGLDALGMLPGPEAARATQVEPGERFAVDYTLFLNVSFLVISAGMATLIYRQKSGHDHDHDHGGGSSWMDRILLTLACGSIIWLTIGLGLNALSY